MTLRPPISAALLCCFAATGLVGADLVSLDLGQGTVIRFSTPAPVLWEGERIPEPAFDAAGNALAAGLKLRRTVEKVAGGYRIQLSVTNLRQKEVALKSLVPVQAVGQENLVVAGRSIGQWQIFRMARHKNDIPGPYRPTRRDDASRDAVFDSSGGTRTDDPGEAKKVPGTRYRSDPGFVVMPDGKPTSAHLFIGFDGQTEHLNDIVIDLEETATRFQKLAAVAEFDGVTLPPGATRETHYLYLQTGKGHDALLEDHVERIKRRYGARTADQRNVFCTWYFYGPEITADDIRNDLAELKKRPIKLDLFLIDYGWSDRFGDWNADRARFPLGMKKMAGEIRRAGLTPGIWSAPFLIENNAEVLKKHPNLLLRNRAGEYVRFEMLDTVFYVVDPTAPSAEAFLGNLVRRIAGWGYGYLKFDFLRAVVIHDNAVFHDRSANRAQAYRRGIEILRKAAGDEALIGFWGGLYEASAGIVDINRSGSDVRGHWDPVANGAYHTRYPVRIRQTFARAFYDRGRLWTSDQDALQLRRRTQPWRRTKLHISMGNFTEEEAFSTLVYRFLGGGIIQVAEKLDELDQDRYDLYKMVIPTYAPVAKPFGGWDEYLPEYFVSSFSGNTSLPFWAVVSLCNWNGNARKELAFRIGDVPHLPRAASYAGFEFRTQKWLGVLKPDDIIRLELPPHAARVIRLTPIYGDGAYLIGTDLNMSCGMEIESMRGKQITLRNELRDFPAKFTLLNVANGATSIETVEYRPGMRQVR